MWNGLYYPLGFKDIFAGYRVLYCLLFYFLFSLFLMWNTYFFCNSLCMFLTTNHLKIYKIFSLALVFSLSAVKCSSVAQCVCMYHAQGSTPCLAKGWSSETKQESACVVVPATQACGKRQQWDQESEASLESKASLYIMCQATCFYSFILLFPTLFASVTYLLLISEIQSQ